MATSISPFANIKTPTTSTFFNRFRWNWYQNSWFVKIFHIKHSIFRVAVPFKTNSSIKHYNSIISVQPIVFECCRNHYVTLLTLEDSTEFKKKIIIFKKIKNYKIWARTLCSDRFIKTFFWLKALTIIAKMATETGFLPDCLVKCITCLLDRGLHYHLWKNY